MGRFGLTMKQLELIEGAICRLDGIQDVVVFGSRAMGNYKPGSDMDIAIKGRDVALELSVLLNEELPLPYYFDVVHYESIQSESLTRHIDEYGITL